MKNILAISIFVLAMLIAGAQADYYNPPAWDTNDPTFTHQEWFFNDGSRSAAADVDNNLFGTPEFTINGATWFSSASQYISGSTRTGLWAGVFSGSAQTTLTLPLDENSTMDHLVWMQVTIGCTTIDGLTMTANIAGAEVLSENLYAMPSGEQYGYYYEKLWRVSPTANAVITSDVSFSGGIIALDAVAVDTIAVPEPATMALLGLGGLLCRKIKRA